MRLKNLINYLLEENAKTFSGLYHGSSRRFEEFSLPSKVSQRGSGIFFSNSLKYAKEFGPYIYHCNVKLSNPKVYATSLDFTIAEMKQGSVERLYSDLKTEGYDGIIIKRSKVSTGVVKEVIAFEPSQVEIKEVLEVSLKENIEKTAKSGDFWYHTTSGANAEKKREMIVEGLTAPKNKKLLLLVHPDAVFEMHMDDTNFIKEYMKRLRETFTLPTFDYVITHLMFSKDAPEVVPGIRDRKELWDEFKELLKSESDWIGLDRKFSASFSDALPDYLIENEGTEIWLGGGYKDLCVEDTRKQLFMKLNDIIELTGAKVVGCYASLIFTERHRPSFGDSK